MADVQMQLGAAAVPLTIEQTICLLYQNYAFLVAAVVLALSCVSRELLFFLYSITSQFFLLAMVLLQEYVVYRRMDRFCGSVGKDAEAATELHGWPSIIHAQIGIFVGFIAVYSILWKCWRSFWITKAIAIIVMLAVAGAAVYVGMTDALAAISGVLLGLIYAVAFLWYLRSTLCECTCTETTFGALLQCSYSIDTLICPKFVARVERSADRETVLEFFHIPLRADR